MKYLKRWLAGSGSDNGFIMPTILSFMIFAIIMAAAVAEVVDTNISTVDNNAQRQQAFNIAEAGINYYLWHLSHNPSDYKDGQSTPTTPDPNLGYGPYTHNYIDSNGIDEGTYTLWIKPQGGGSTIATVESIGQVKGSDVIRTIQAQIGEPSFASYAVNDDSALWFGADEAADGPIHSNQGIRMDGPNNDIVTSTNSTYVPSTQLGGDGHTSEPGVWCSSSVTSPVNCNTRDKSTWQYPSPSIDFNQVTTSLCTMKKIAFASNSSTSGLDSTSNPCSQVPTTRTAAYLPERSTNGSFSLTSGYLIQLDSNDTYDLYYVNGENDTKSPYTSALTLQSVATGIAIPSSGVIFAEDNVWVRSNPTFNGRVTIAAGRLASNYNADIVIADDLLYASKNGTDSIGLVAEGDVLIAPYAPPTSGSFTYEVDAAILSENGNVEYPVYYRSSPNSCTRGWVNSSQQLLFYGSVSTRQTWTWNWLVGGNPCGNAAHDPVNGYISGIENTITQYDYNLLYAPPPSYPITSGYNIISWREVLTRP